MPQSREVGQAAPQLPETCAVWMHGALPLGHGSLQSLLVPSRHKLPLRTAPAPVVTSVSRQVIISAVLAVHGFDVYKV